MKKLYIVYDTHNNGIVYGCGSAKQLAELLGIKIGSFYCTISSKRLINKRFEIMQMGAL
jgi:hypothetical protein